MQSTPKTIQIFLPSGDPRGIRVAEITTRIVRVIEVPRSLLEEFRRLPEAKQVGLYFLVGNVADDAALLQLYIGQSGDVGARLANHNQNKDFWNKALVVVSLTNNLTDTHARLLEWLSIKEGQAADRYQLENGNGGTRPYTPAPLEADCFEIYETARTLLATLGYPIFDPVAKPAEKSEAEEVFYCKAAGANGRGLYTAEGFVVLAGSRGRVENVPSIQGTGEERYRQRLFDSEVMRVDGTSVFFPQDHLFGSPSMAALALLGRTANGWIEWKDADGRTLHELKRQTTDNLAES